MNSDEADFVRIAQVLRHHCGRSNAITIDRLSVEAGLISRYRDDGSPVPDRRRCELILQLRKNDFSFLIVGSGSGMYVATDQEDLNHERNSRISRIRTIATGWSVLRRKAIALGWSFENGRFVRAPVQPLLFDLSKPDSRVA